LSAKQLYPFVSHQDGASEVYHHVFFSRRKIVYGDVRIQ